MNYIVRDTHKGFAYDGFFYIRFYFTPFFSERGIQSNYKQYGFTPVEIMRLDMSQSSWRAGKAEIFEAIISDPPYGRRESRKRIDEERQDKLDTFVSALNDEQKKDRLDKLAQNYIPPPKREYVMNDLLTDLVDKAAKVRPTLFILTIFFSTKRAHHFAPPLG